MCSVNIHVKSVETGEMVLLSNGGHPDCNHVSKA